MSVEIKEHSSQEFKIIALKGGLDSYTSAAIEDKLNGFIDEGMNKFIVDMGDVNYLGSSGIRVFISITRRLDKAKGSLAIVNLTPSCRKIFETMGLEILFHIFDSEIEAVRFLQTR